MTSFAWFSLGIDGSDPKARDWYTAVGLDLAQKCSGNVVRMSPAIAPGTGYAEFISQFSTGAGLEECAFVDPESIVEQSTSNYADQSPIGRFEPARTFMNNQPRQVSFRVHLVASSGGELGCDQFVYYPAVFLDSLCQPSSAKDWSPLPPPPVSLSIGGGEILSMRGYVTNCSIEWGGGTLSGRYISAVVDMTVAAQPYGFGNAFAGQRNFASRNS